MDQDLEISAPVLLFDGVCSLCNHTVDFVLRVERSNKLKFASLQSPYGQSVLKKLNLDPVNFKSFILQEGENFFTESTAVIRISKHLGGLWPIFQILLVIPKFIRDAVYGVIAKNRYKWFGKRDTCRLPTPEERSRFLG